MKTRLFIIIFVAIMISPSLVLESAIAAQITANINPQNPESQFTAKYHTTVQIEYNDGGKIRDMLNDKNWIIKKTADTTNLDSIEIAARLNQKIAQDGSNAQISNLSIVYQAVLVGKSNSASIDYSITLTGTLSNYIILPYVSDTSRPALIDIGWRGISISGPVMIDGYDINLPISAIMEKEPKVYSMMAPHPKVIDLLSVNIIDVNAIQYIPLSDWHFLFDPTGLNLETLEFEGIEQSFPGFVISEYSLDNNRLQVDYRNTAKSTTSESFMADADYRAKIIQPVDSANIRIMGFAMMDTLDGVEILGITPYPPEGYAVTTTGDIPIVSFYALFGGIVIVASIVGYLLFRRGTLF